MGTIISIGNAIGFQKGSKLNLPLIATLNSTGTGAGVSTLRFTVTEEQVIIVDGAARFYTDSSGTLNESTSWTVTPGALRTIYIRCPNGSSSLHIPKPKSISEFGNKSLPGWITTTNSPIISGDISGLINLTYLVVNGSNTLSGDISGLINLTYLSVEGQNTLSGDISGLINLTNLFALGQNTLSGDISGLINLTNLTVAGQNTLSGDIGGIGTNALVNGITRVYILGNNRMTTYTAGATWSLTGLSTIINPAAGYGYSSDEIDNILIDMAASIGTVTSSTITLKGSSAPRTSASDVAVATLNSKGWTVVTN